MHISSLSYFNKITVHQKHKETQKILTPYSKSKYCTIVDRFAVQTTKLNQNRDFLVHVCFFRILLSSTKNGVQWVFIFTASIKTKVFLPDRKKGNRNISTGTKFFWMRLLLPPLLLLHYILLTRSVFVILSFFGLICSQMLCSIAQVCCSQSRKHKWASWIKWYTISKKRKRSIA